MIDINIIHTIGSLITSTAITMIMSKLLLNMIMEVDRNQNNHWVNQCSHNDLMGRMLTDSELTIKKLNDKITAVEYHLIELQRRKEND